MLEKRGLSLSTAIYYALANIDRQSCPRPRFSGQFTDVLTL